MAFSALIGAWLAGVLGGLHCLAMCGGFLTAMAGGGAPDSTRARPLLRAGALVRRQLPYHLGRITTYALLGAIAGGAGAFAISASASLLTVQRVMFVIANLFLLALAASIAGTGRTFPWLERTGAALFGKILPAVQPLLVARSLPARIAAGMVWGLVPCALTYSVLPIALFAGGVGEGAIVMLAFGLGTLPNLLVVGVAAARARRWLEARSLRLAAAFVIAVFAVIGIARALFGAPSLAHGPFCF